jgi:hypothetical protein
MHSSGTAEVQTATAVRPQGRFCSRMAEHCRSSSLRHANTRAIVPLKLCATWGVGLSSTNLQMYRRGEVRAKLEPILEPVSPDVG